MSALGLDLQVIMTGGPPEDHDVVAQLRAATHQGDRARANELFALLVHRYQKRVFRLALSVLGPGHRAEAEDVAQEVFLRVHRHLDEFRAESRFSTWLYRISYRRAVDYKRRARHRLPHVDDEVLASLPAVAAGALAEALDAEERIRVYAAVEALREPHRSAVYLYYWLDEPVDAIAELLDTRPGTVKAWLFRARKRIGRLLPEDLKRARHRSDRSGANDAGEVAR